MKLFIHAATSPYEYNQKQTQVGSPLKTLKGSRIGRSTKYGVGKEIGGDIYFYRIYAEDVIPHSIWSAALTLLNTYDPTFRYNCIKYNPKLQIVSFQECPDFNTAREPKVGDYISVDVPNAKIRKGHSDYIFHHKWLWCRNDYSGFNVADAWNWSKTWLSVLQEPSDGNGIARWNAQLDRYDLPHDN